MTRCRHGNRGIRIVTLVRLEAVGKRYGLRNWVVRDVTAEVAEGRLVRLAGPNGSGKSTLLRMAARVSLPSAGRITGRLPTGYVPERFPPALPLTARDYLRHLGRVHGLRGRMLAARIDECLERLGAAGDAGLPMRGMSKGMCQKVAVAQALLAPPGLLVLDEAWTGLDQAARTRSTWRRRSGWPAAAGSCSSTTTSGGSPAW
jgi:ABC-type multidrug transport system ATPase subunit